MSSDVIYNYKKVDELVTTAGQPTEDQLKAAYAEGLGAVVNLATIDPRYSLPDERAFVKAQGIDYYHLPVDFTQPTRADFQAFCKLMDGLQGKKVLIHCAANYRVTAFYSLYAMAELNWTAAVADDFIASIWEPSEFEAWANFIRDIRVDIGAKS
ncbi:MAG: protein tyrosine phosphatase family protein [Pseudomonadales bacterium]|jgi:protein tyrosine phosphatase (PTP) superfamily phosphohydrolase (DUF442 family)|nr:protein tyrosine phosphatase family protein [Pseudomonadales bacterium]MDP7145105.1 protein tyrosine phosphatase family protein [Pseudomonadales bacterium]MDP7359531.1 protein tyrosine phosphatase family protein [Pseudomonadales bacterium]MDP7594950.1 protein tyrosine phosphatase family protein [Pseudomonadales bacterium]HJN51260.1 protein tyrosine phosphatase family protein [Pseudomonadales bacterium]|tara:strand:+ start:98 stop:562 length:465 start_codon:yes stop_codon:yes gene_type:complete